MVFRFTLPILIVVSNLLAGGCEGGEAARISALQSKCSSQTANYNRENIKGCTTLLAEPSLSPRDRAMTLNSRGNTYDKLGEYDLAIADYTEVARLTPNFAYAYANIALVHCRNGDFKAAVGFYEQALKVNPKNSYAMYGRGVALSRLGQATAAREQIKAALATDPEMASVYKQIGMEPAP
jgi:lipoprotein NlpI